MTCVIPDSDYVLFCEFTKIRDQIGTYSPNNLHLKKNNKIRESVLHIVGFSHLARERWDGNTVYLLNDSKVIIIQHYKAGGVSHLYYAQWTPSDWELDHSLLNPRYPISAVQELRKLLQIEI